MVVRAPISTAARQALALRLPLAGAVILIGEPRDATASIVRAKLLRDGAAAVLWRRSTAGVADALAEGGVDLAQIDLELPDGDPIKLARRVRFGEVGANPFLPVMITTWRPVEQVIASALSAGADDVVANPVSAMTLSKRIRRFAAARKPFVAANAYIGPVRPRMPHDLRYARQFEAPNTLRALALGRAVDLEENLLQVETARRRLMSLRVEVAAEAVADSARRALAAKPEAMADPDACRALGAAACALKAIAEVVPAGNLLGAMSRLAALADIAAAAGEEAERAAQLAVDIAEALGLIIQADRADALVLPSDIIERMDRRFPGLNAA